MTISESERAKAHKTVPNMLAYLVKFPHARTEFAERWIELCLEHGTQIYVVRRPDGAPGRRLQHGYPARIVECIESAAPVGRPGLWFVKVVGSIGINIPGMN